MFLSKTEVESMQSKIIPINRNYNVNQIGGGHARPRRLSYLVNTEIVSCVLVTSYYLQKILMFDGYVT